MSAPFTPPRGIRRLPFDSLRSGIVTRDPATAAAAMQAYQQHMAGGELPTYLPQPVLHQAWKRNPGFATQGHYKDPMQDVRSVMAALHSRQPPPSTSAYTLDSYPSTVRTMRVVADPMNRLPEPGRPNVGPFITRIRPVQQPTLPPEAAMKMAPRGPARPKWHACQAALLQARAAAGRAVSTLRENPENKLQSMAGLDPALMRRLERHQREHQLMRAYGLARRRR